MPLDPNVPTMFTADMDPEEMATKANFMMFALSGALACLRGGKHEPVKHACNILEKALNALNEKK
jgi:hypothetical protein